MIFNCEYRQYGIASNELTLEVGSGHDPSSISDILCDKYIEFTNERKGPIFHDKRPLLGAAGEFLPFKDKSIDYIICQHVLEHVHDPGALIKEITRVGKKGYIETPSRFHEAIYENKLYHRWIIELKQDKLYCYPKPDNFSRFSTLFTKIWESNIYFNQFHKCSPELMFTFFEWKDSIEYVIANDVSELFDAEEYASSILKSAERANRSKRRNKINAFFDKVKRAGNTTRNRYKKQVFMKAFNLNSILCCPVVNCHGELNHKQDNYQCLVCGRIYPIKNGIPRFQLD